MERAADASRPEADPGRRGGRGRESLERVLEDGGGLVPLEVLELGERDCGGVRAGEVGVLQEAALEDERIAKLRAAAEASDGDGEDSSGDSKGKTSLDVPSRGRTLGLGTRDKRKRWSVCGAERRGDLDLETIWED